MNFESQKDISSPHLTMMKFNTNCYTSQASSITFNPKEYFAEYHYWEPYDENKLYEKESYDREYVKEYGILNYQNALYDISFGNGAPNQLFVVANENLSLENAKLLENDCQCSVCTASFFSLTRYFSCSCCHGCLKSGMPQQYVINRTRKYMAEKNK